MSRVHHKQQPQLVLVKEQNCRGASGILKHTMDRERHVSHFHLRHFPGIVLRQLQKAQSYQKAGGNKGLMLRMEELLDSRKDSPETLTRGKGI